MPSSEICKYAPLQQEHDIAIGRLAEDHSAAVNKMILMQYQQLRQHPEVKHTHLFHGRYENTYIPRSLIPAIEPVLQMGLAYAEQLLGIAASSLRLGFWFNEMHGGHQTTLHTHDDDDELLSAAYYISVAENSGDLKIHTKSREIRYISPQEGSIILFSPELPHAVTENKSGEMRLSVAMNFGRLVPDN